MKKQKEDNTVAIIQRAVKHFGIAVTSGTIREALKSHPHYPSFKSICDTLNEWNVEHYAVKYEPKELLDVPAPYIAHLEKEGGLLAFVSDITNDHVTYYESYNLKKKSESINFINRCSGAIIILNPDENSGESDYLKKWQEEMIRRAVLPVIFFTFLIFTALEMLNIVSSGLISANSKYGLLFLTKITGIILSVVLVLQEFDIRNSITNKLCHLNQSTNCNIVLNDKSAKFFGWFGWADTGLIYFSGGLLILMQGFNAHNFSLVAIVSAMSLPYPIFSIYYQGLILKKWCPLCLGVQLVLILEFMLLAPQLLNLHITYYMTWRFFLTYLVIGIVYTLSILFFREQASYDLITFSNLKFKRDPNILKFLMSKQNRFNIPISRTSLVFGAKNSQITITVFLSLNCSPCAKAFESIKKILHSGMTVKINILILTQDSKFLNTLFLFVKQNKNDEAFKLLNEWYNTDPTARNKVSENLCIPEVEDYAKEVIDVNYKLFHEYNLVFTPTFFINGYLLPNQYDIEDIKYFNDFFRFNNEMLISRNLS